MELHLHFGEQGVLRRGRSLVSLNKWMLDTVGCKILKFQVVTHWLMHPCNIVANDEIQGLVRCSKSGSVTSVTVYRYRSLARDLQY